MVTLAAVGAVQVQPGEVRWRTAAVFLAGAAVAVAAGVYGRVHDPTGHALFDLIFTSTLTMKTWFTTIAVVLGVVQVLTALRMYGKIHVPAKTPPWFGELHRLTGSLAFLFTIPVAYHCLWALGFAGTENTRRFVHSVLGCAFYGAFAAKILAVRLRSLPGWVLPLVGGFTFTALVGVWATSALWFFVHVGVQR